MRNFIIDVLMFVAVLYFRLVLVAFLVGPPVALIWFLVWVFG